MAAVEKISAAGFRRAELTAEGEAWRVRGYPDAAMFRAVLKRTGIDPMTIHTPYNGVNIASLDEAVRLEAVRRIADAMRFAGEVGARTAVVHPTGRPGPKEQPYRLEMLGAAAERVHRSLSELVKVAEETGVRIALENLSHVGLACRPLESVQELRAFIAGFPSEWVGLCLDVGHARLSGFDPAGQARMGAERLWALHLQDVDGEKDCHWVPGRGVIDWASLGRALSDIAFDGAWTLEVLTANSDSTPEQLAAQCASLGRRWAASGMSS
jgi:sugar phosphate isomerase/epimerase